MDAVIDFARKLAFTNLPLPKRSRWRLFRSLVDLQFNRFLKTRFGLYFRKRIPCPTPPAELYVKVGGSKPDEFKQRLDPSTGFEHMYYSLGRYTVLRFLQLVERHGGNARTLGTVFELGCGTGRLIQHLQAVEGLRLIGSDLNSEMVNWCRKNVPGGTFFKNEVEPPLTFLADDSVDLAYCYSVFTHIPLDLQKPWLEEFRRVLRPGGFLICTIAGRRLQKQFLAPEDFERLQSTGQVEYTSDDEGASLATQVGGSAWDVYQTRSEVVRVFGSVLALRDYLTIGQDVLVLQKEPALGRGATIERTDAAWPHASAGDGQSHARGNGLTSPLG